jgi:hypothetical protein
MSSRTTSAVLEKAPEEKVREKFPVFAVTVPPLVATGVVGVVQFTAAAVGVGEGVTKGVAEGVAEGAPVGDAVGFAVGTAVPPARTGATGVPLVLELHASSAAAAAQSERTTTLVRSPTKPVLTTIFSLVPEATSKAKRRADENANPVAF